MRFVHDHPELGHEERECSTYLCETLAAGGLEVERGVAGMETAFRATLRGGRPGRTVGFVCLYDAVAAVRPDGRTEAVHSCGHGPIAGACVGARWRSPSFATGWPARSSSSAALRTRSMRRARSRAAAARR